MKHVLLYPVKMLDDRPEVHVRRYAMSDDVEWYKQFGLPVYSVKDYLQLGSELL